jgi:type IV pilus assembly protein PilM
MGEDSIWKKEISFKRKAKPAEEAVQPEAPKPTAAGAPEQPTSVWKKELSFGRKKEKQPEQPKAETAAGDSTSLWKKEISFGRKKAAPAPAAPAADDTVELPAPAADEPEYELGPVPDAIAHILAPVEPEAPMAEPVAEVPAEPVYASEPDVAPVAEAASTPVPVPAPEPVAEPESVVLHLPVPEHAPAALAPEPVAAGEAWEDPSAVPPAPEPAPAPAPAPALAPAPAPALAPAPAPMPAAEPVAPTVAEAAAEPVVVHPPVPASERPPDPSGKVPFWKKDLSFGGGKKKQTKEKKPKAEKAPKAEKPPKEPKEKKQKAPKEPRERRRLRAPKSESGGGKGAKRLVGLKVGASQLAAARVSNNGVAELLQVAREPLNPGIVVGGELREPDALAEALKEFFKKNRLPKKGVRLGIANNRIGVRTFEIDGIDDPKQLDNAIKFRAQETLPIPIEDAVLDYQILGEETREDGQKVRKVLLVVAYRDLVDRYIDACRKAGITLSGIDLEAFALLRALQAPQAGAGGNAGAALVAVAIGHDRSTFAVSDGRICEFTRVLEWGGSALNIALARTLDAAPSEVEELKRDLPLNVESVPEGMTADRAAQARDAMRRAIQVFARELVSSLQYYQNQPGSLGIGEIVLSGGTAHLAGLSEELERLIGVRVRVGDPLARMKVAKKVGDPEQVGSLAVAIGLGIED